MTTSCAFCMVGMYSPTFECCNGIFDTTRLVESVGMNKNLQDNFNEYLKLFSNTNWLLTNIFLTAFLFAKA